MVENPTDVQGLLRFRLWFPGRACPLHEAPGQACCLAAPECPLGAPCPLRLCPADTTFQRVQVTHDGIMADLGVPEPTHVAEAIDAVEEAGETDIVAWGLPGPHPELPVVIRGNLSPLLLSSLPHSQLVDPLHLPHHDVSQPS